MEPKLTADDLGRGPAASGPGRPLAAAAETAVTALYRDHAVGPIRLAVVMLGDRPAAEGVVQEAATCCEAGQCCRPCTRLAHSRTTRRSGRTGRSWSDRPAAQPRAAPPRTRWL